MQDRFKFRVWDKINEKWINNCILDIESGYLCGYYDNEQAYKRRYKIMQSTGLKDKNGKLIYEGDIVKTSKGVANVEYDNTYAYFGLTNFLTVFSFDNFINEEIEVIGNIYENKELL